MANRRSTLLITGALVLGAALLPASPLAARPAQDPGATFGGAGTETSTTLAVTTTAAATTTAADGTNQTLVESEDSPDQPLFTENRKVAAVIGGLLFVALALLLLTIRYIRVTKPLARPATSAAAAAVATTPAAVPVELDDDAVFVATPEDPPPVFPDLPDGPAIEAPTADATAIAASGGADHDAADADWEPRTDEHQRVDIASGPPLARPGLAARRKTLGVDPD